MSLNKFLVSFIICSFSFIVDTSAQVTEPEEDFDAPVDTAAFYKKLHNYSKNRKILFWIYKSVFNPPDPPTPAKKKKPEGRKISMKRYEGRIIRNIEVTSLDPFGTSVNDTARKPHSFVQKAGNVLHVETRRRTILNFILLKKNTPLDSLKVTESERLLRSTGFIRDVKISVIPVKGTRDSVDIHVLSQDYWSLQPDVNATTVKVRYRLRERNFLGWGHTFENRVTDRLNESSPLIFDGSYTIPSLGTSYISPRFFYGSSPSDYVRGISVNRPFYSPLTKFAGGVDVLTRSFADSIRSDEDSVYAYKYTSFLVDYWTGYSFPLRKGKTVEERSTRLVGAVRYGRTRFPELKPLTSEVKRFFQRSDMYLASISLSSRKYVNDRYIFKFGDQEDVPDGRKASFTAGHQNRAEGMRFYVGFDGAIGSYIPGVGYLYLGAGYGTFLDRKAKNTGVISSNIIYFTNLTALGRWRARGFASANFIYGINRNPDEFVQLNVEDGIPGYREDLPRGTNRATLTLQSIFYSPYEFLGFRFAPILLTGFGVVGTDQESIFKSRLYQTYGFGVLVKNELLVLNSFQVTLAIYPVLPVRGTTDLRFNPVKLNEQRFRDFDISKPEVAPFY